MVLGEGGGKEKWEIKEKGSENTEEKKLKKKSNNKKGKEDKRR